MAKPIKLREFLKRVKDLDPAIEVFVNRGKGIHLMLCKNTHSGKVSFPVPTSTGEVAGPYQKAVIRRFGLPEDAFKKLR